MQQRNYKSRGGGVAKIIRAPYSAVFGPSVWNSHKCVGAAPLDWASTSEADQGDTKSECEGMGFEFETPSGEMRTTMNYQLPIPGYHHLIMFAPHLVVLFDASKSPAVVVCSYDQPRCGSAPVYVVVPGLGSRTLSNVPPYPPPPSPASARPCLMRGGTRLTIGFLTAVSVIQNTRCHVCGPVVVGLDHACEELLKTMFS